MRAIEPTRVSQEAVIRPLVQEQFDRGFLRLQYLLQLLRRRRVHRLVGSALVQLDGDLQVGDLTCRGFCGQWNCLRLT